MPIFNAYFKIIKKNLVPLLVYFFVFAAIALLMTAMMGKPASAFTEAKTNIAFFSSEKETPLVNGLRDYLSKKAHIVDIPDDTQNIQDALFYGDIGYVVRVPEGFTDSFLNGRDDVAVQRTAAARSTDSVYMDYLVNKYLNTVGLYVQNMPGSPETRIVENAQKDLEVSAAVDMNTYGKPADTNYLSYYFQFFAYPIMAILIWGVTSFMMAYNEPDFSNRNLCSPVKPLRMNLQIVLGNLTFALAVWAALNALIFLIHGSVTFDTGTVLLCLNALAFTLVSLSIGFLAGRLVKTHPAQAAVTNVISLGICFISGVFVEQALLGKTVLTISSFTPGYWYVKAVDDIRNLTVIDAQSIMPIVYSLLIQLGFAVAIMAIALAVTKQRRVGALASA